jgi:hypothetical protein
VRGLERARSELERADVRTARERLKGLPGRRGGPCSARPGVPADGGGALGYLIGPAATDEERLAFERHSAFGWASRITEPRLRHLLPCSDLSAIADEPGRAILAFLPSKKPPHRREGLDAVVVRWFAGLRAASRHGGAPGNWVPILVCCDGGAVG